SLRLSAPSNTCCSHCTSGQDFFLSSEAIKKRSQRILRTCLHSTEYGNSFSKRGENVRSPLDIACPPESTERQHSRWCMPNFLKARAISFATLRSKPEPLLFPPPGRISIS